MNAPQPVSGRSRPIAPARSSWAVRAAAVAVALLAVAEGAVDAQSTPDVRLGWELVVPSGTLIPTGAQRDAIRRGGLTALQVSRTVSPSVAVTTTIGWARSRDLASVGTPRLDVFAFDIGGELRGPRWFAEHRVTLRPFGGVGGGVRSYDPRSLDVAATHNATMYASVGGEVGLGRFRVRLEARDYLTRFSPLGAGGSTRTSNEVALMAGLRWVRR